ncbi:hypothetical protein OGH69_08845 [Flavobacterium sp. MFBS3-15]|uniref:hypothetical protein n=1 Tax=Flavobacterium sp. MFBS3-15 TaxID=2989816 RepID=UPI0022355789|nr:hypothetical protein [Flavobacterium sp. MFBS3-15]MCW4469068.1 hypothetical protein [Flavobacterium sp. MFBS3-15]
MKNKSHDKRTNPNEMHSFIGAFCCLLFSVGSNAQTKQRQNATYTPVETIITDLNADTVNDTIILYQTPVEGDPGLFTKMNVSVNGRRMTFFAKNAWDEIGFYLAETGQNAVLSKNAYVHKEGIQSYIFLFGFPYGSGREEVFILKVKGRNMDIIFHNKLEELQRVSDLDNDGHAEMIVRRSPQFLTVEEDIGTYSPFIIYSLENFSVNKSLTEKYNKEHYIWEGIEYNDQIEVYYPNDGSKPKLLKP